MSYDLGLKDPASDTWCLLDEPHQMKGGTYCVGGSSTAEINITYNYGEILHRVMPVRKSDHPYADNGTLHGIRSLYGLTGAESIPILTSAIMLLGDDLDDDYWKATDGNVKRQLRQCLALARMRPDGVWDGD